MDIRDELFVSDFVPFDKSWIMRMGLLDIVHGRHHIREVLAGQEGWGDDLCALRRCANDWNSDRPLDVGESATLYRFLLFASWKLGTPKKFLLRGTLSQRPINQDPSIISYRLQDLLKLDNGTSQWASAAVLLGNKEIIPDPPYKLALTYEAVAHWFQQRDCGEHWDLPHDDTILYQAAAFVRAMQDGYVEFPFRQAEDYCVARAFGWIGKTEGEAKWPSLRGHESDRIEEMECALQEFQSGTPITSRDHRVVQAIAMYAKFKRKEVAFLHPHAVNKSWPRFWKFLEAASARKRSL